MDSYGETQEKPARGCSWPRWREKGRIGSRPKRNVCPFGERTRSAREGGIGGALGKEGKVTSGLWFSDDDLIAKLTSVEDQFVERKSKSDKGGWLRTTVAFANSTPIGETAVLFIGVDNDGVITDNANVEDTMKSYSDTISNSVWPLIYTAPRVVTLDGKSCIAVIIPGSAERPHFAGKSYVRSGTQSVDASETQYTELIAERMSKVRELLAWKGKSITLESVNRRGNFTRRGFSTCVVVDCNQFFLTAAFSGQERSIPLTQLAISRDDNDYSRRLKIEVEE